MALPAFAAERRAAALLYQLLRRPPPSNIDRYLLPAQQQTRRTPKLLSNDGTDRRTRTPDCCTDPAPDTVRAVLLLGYL